LGEVDRHGASFRLLIYRHGRLSRRTAIVIIGIKDRRAGGDVSGMPLPPTVSQPDYGMLRHFELAPWAEFGTPAPSLATEQRPQVLARTVFNPETISVCPACQQN
jgi:hypothetical protein